MEEWVKVEHSMGILRICKEVLIRVTWRTLKNTDSWDLYSTIYIQ